MLSRFTFVALLLMLASVSAPGQAPQKFDAPKTMPPDAEQLQEIEKRTRQLQSMIADLAKQGVSPMLLSDIDVYAKAADWIVRHGEFYHPDSAKWTLAALDRGSLRANQMARGEAAWLAQLGLSVARGYRSRVDGSTQPYAVIYPKNYLQADKPFRLDIVLHGRDASLTEAKFLNTHNGSKNAPEHDFVQIDIYGRGNNAYRWAGETDVFEAIDHFLAVERSLGRANRIDLKRIVLRGFSMGGAGSWHIGLHHPDRWCVIGPGAGFTTTRGYIANLPEKLPPDQEACLHIYDAVDYAENAFDVPVVAYGGDKDPQLQAAVNIQDALKPLGIPMKLLIAEGLAHSFPPEQQKRAEIEYAMFAGPGKGRTPFAERVRFVTYTLKYPSCDWVEVLGLDQHYVRSHVDATRSEEGVTVKTTNIRAMRLTLPTSYPFPRKVTIDGQEVSTEFFARRFATNGYFEKSNGKWTAVLAQRLLADRQRMIQKVPRLQGPIDDAFTDGFICVTGGGTAWNEAIQQSTDAQLARFEKEWDKWLRGKVVVKTEGDIADEDISARNLILFGDPGSNSLIAQVVARLPITWTETELVVNGQKYDPKTHFPTMIFPNPLNPNRYVVINSGHTFHEKDFKGTNALLFPKFGDYAVMKVAATDDDPAATENVQSGLFDEFWAFPKK